MTGEASFTEIVQFSWLLSGPEGPDTAAEKMLESLGKIDARISAIDTNAQTVFGASFATSLAPAITAVNSLNTALDETLKKLQAIKEVGPIDPLGSGGAPPPPPNNPHRPDLVVRTEGEYALYESNSIKGPGGHYASPANAPPELINPPTPAGYLTPPSTPATFSGDLFSPSGPNQPRLSPPGFLGGGISYDTPSEFTSRLEGQGYTPPGLSSSPVPPSTMRPGEIERELARLREQSSQLNQALIYAGRGSERPTDRANATDEISLTERAIAGRMQELRYEIEQRAGPGQGDTFPSAKRGSFGPRQTPADYQAQQDRLYASPNAEIAASLPAPTRPYEMPSAEESQRRIDEAVAEWRAEQVTPSQPYQTPHLANLGWMGENNPRFQTQSFDNPALSSGITPEQSDLLNSQTAAANDLPPWLSKLLGQGQYQKPQLTQGALSNQRLSDEQAAAVFQMSQSLNPLDVKALSPYSKPELIRGELPTTPLSDEQLSAVTRALSDFANRFGNTPFSDWQGLSNYNKPLLGRGALTSNRLDDEQALSVFQMSQNLNPLDISSTLKNYTTPLLTRGGLTSVPPSDEQLNSITKALKDFADRPAPFSNWQTSLGPLPQTQSISVPGAAVDLNALSELNARSTGILQSLTDRLGTPITNQWQGSSGMELSTIRANTGWQSNFYNPNLPNMTMGNGFTMYPPGFNPGPMSATPFSWPLLGAPGGGGGGMGGGFIPPGWYGGGGYGGAAAGGGGMPPLGPFGENFMQQMAANFAQSQGNAAFAKGNMQFGEDWMQKIWIPQMLQARSTAAGQNEVVSAADFARLPGPTGQKYYDQFYYQQEGQNLGAQMATAQSAVPPDPTKIQQLGEQIKANKQAQNDLNESTSSYDNIITRIATRIAVYTAIFAAINLASQAAKSFVANLLELNDVSSRIGFINGQNQNSVQGQFAQAAQYGITPAQAGPGILAGAQLGASPQQQQQAAQLAEVFGTNEYSTALLGLTRIQAQANATGLAHVQVMDFIAQSYKNTPGSLEDYISALQHGIVLNAQFGVSAEAMGLAIEKASVGTGQSADQISVTFQSILSKIGTPATQKALQGEGITSGTPQEMVSQIVAKYEQLAAVGDRAGIQKLGEALQGGGIGGYSRIENLPVVFSAFNDALGQSNLNLAKFDGLLADVSGTGVTKVGQLKASWESFLLALGNTGPIQAAFDFITAGLTSDTGILNSLGKIIPGLINNSGAIASSNPLNDAKRLAHYEEMNPIKNESDFGYNPATFAAYLADYISKVMDYMSAHPGTMGERPGPDRSGFPSDLRVPQSVLNPYPAPIENFGGLQTLPQGVGMADYLKMVQQKESQLKIAGVPVDDKNYELLSKSGDLLGQMLADTNAIKLTNEDIARNTTSFGGMAPSGITAANASDFQARVTAEDKKLRDAGITVSDPRTVVYQDRTTGELFRIAGSTEATAFATQDMAARMPSFAGILPKGENLDKVQARVNQIDQSGEIGAAGLDTTTVKQVFWDPVTGHLKAISGTAIAIQIASEESAKLLQQQITGTFNVPSGGEAVVAFYALQQGFMPSDRAGGSNGAAALTGSAGQLTGSANQLNAAAQALKSAAALMNLDPGNQGVLGWLIAQAQANQNGASPSTTPASVFHTPQTSNYPNPNATSGIGYPGEFHTPQTSNYPGALSAVNQSRPPYSTQIDPVSPYSTNPYNRNLLPLEPAGPNRQISAPANINITNAIRISIDSRMVAYYQNRKTYREFETVRNTVAGSPNSAITM